MKIKTPLNKGFTGKINMTGKNKSNLLIWIIVIAAIGLALYFMFRKKNKTALDDNKESSANISLSGHGRRMLQQPQLKAEVANDRTDSLNLIID